MRLSIFRKMRTKHFFGLVVVLPTLLGAIYYGLIASDQYTSQSRFVIKSASQKQGQLSTLANIVQTTGLSGGQEQTNEVLDFVRSRDALGALERQIGIHKRYSERGGDFLSRFPAPWREDRFENLFRYYGSMVDAHPDNETGVAVLSVRAFTSSDAKLINSSLLQLSEQLVNQLNDRAEKRAIAEAQNRVILAESRIRQARAQMAQYRNSEDIVDPAKQAAGVIEISSALVAERAALNAQLELMQQVAPRNPSIPALQRRIAAISTQIALQNDRVVGPRTAIASKIAAYENLSTEAELASQNLAVANAALEQAHSEAAKQKFYLERIVEPNAPDLALYPSRFRAILTILVASLCLFLVGWMLVTGIVEHDPDH